MGTGAVQMIFKSASELKFYFMDFTREILLHSLAASHGSSEETPTVLTTGDPCPLKMPDFSTNTIYSSTGVHRTVNSRHMKSNNSKIIDKNES